MSVSLQDVFAADQAIRPHIRQTPLVPSASLSALTGAEIRIKLDFLQDTGAFKLRGATNRLLALSREERERGVIAVSTGNHGRAVAAAAARLGIRAVVVMSSLVPEVKVDGVRQFGAEVRIAGNSQDEADAEAARLITAEGLVAVPPFDDPHVIAGQGTIGLELLRDWPSMQAALIPLSGGGLLAGVARVLKAANPAIRIIGISLGKGGAMAESLKAGRPIDVTEPETLADSLGGGIGLQNRHSFEMVRALADDIVTVDDDEIARAMGYLFWNDRLVVEGAGAVAAAALIEGKVPGIGRGLDRIACLSCGNMVDMSRFFEIVGAHHPGASANISTGSAPAPAANSSHSSNQEASECPVAG